MYTRYSMRFAIERMEDTDEADRVESTCKNKPGNGCTGKKRERIS